MCKKSEFQGNKTDSFLFAKGNRLEGWGKVPHSKNSFWGHFLSGVHFPSYSAYQIVYLYRISCLYHKMHNATAKRVHYLAFFPSPVFVARETCCKSTVRMLLCDFIMLSSYDAPRLLTMEHYLLLTNQHCPLKNRKTLAAPTPAPACATNFSGTFCKLRFSG